MKIDSLTTNEKVVLAQQLWDSVASNENSLEVYVSQKAELDRRLMQIEKDSEVGASWD